MGLGRDQRRRFKRREEETKSTKKREEKEEVSTDIGHCRKQGELLYSELHTICLSMNAGRLASVTKNSLITQSNPPNNGELYQ